MWSETPADETSTEARWQTPPEVFQPLHREFRFGLDAAALAGSARVPYYLGPDHVNPERRDAFAADWRASMAPGGRAAWTNPPYGRAMGRWIALLARWGSVIPTVGLILARTDLPWWEGVVMQTCAEVRFVRGRVRFLHGDTGTARDPDGDAVASAPAPSVVLVWRPGHVGPPVFSSWRQARAYASDRPVR